MPRTINDIENESVQITKWKSFKEFKKRFREMKQAYIRLATELEADLDLSPFLSENDRTELTNAKTGSE